jgi:S1-C subfamily serine protease
MRNIVVISSRRSWTRWLVTLGLALGTAASTLAATPPTNGASAEFDARAQALSRAKAAVVGVRAIAVDEARSIETLGRERQGSGVVIGSDGLVLTIGYLILEADRVDLVLAAERVIPARVVAYDQASGFGLLQALAPLRVQAAQMGVSAALSDNEPLLIASGGEDGDLSLARMVSRRAFSGYWEYHIDGALFTAPARSDHSGAALFNANGELLGIGSLVVSDALGPGHPRMPGNMFVPIDLLKPILGEMRSEGASRGSRRAWLGLNCVEQDGVVRVVRLTRDGPAERAGLQAGDRILRIDGAEVKGLESLYKLLWQSGTPEREVAIEIRRAGELQTLKVQTQDRMTILRKPQGI